MIKTISLLPGEQVVTSSDNDILTLTTKRIRYDSASLGSSNFISITLDSVASCGLVTKSYPLLLVLAAAAVIGCFSQQGDAKWVFFGAAVVMAIAYFLTRQAAISIASNGGQTILVPAKSMSRESIIEFLDAVEREKLN